MPSSYSPLLRFEEIGPGEQSGLWGDTTNKNIGELVEQAIAGVTTVSLSGGAGDYTLSALNGALDESRAAVLKFIGSPSGNKNIIIPTSTKLYVVRNECGRTIVVKTAAQVGGVTILTGEATLVFCDGTSAVAGIATAGVGPTTVANGGTGTTGFGAGGFIKSAGTTSALTAQAAIGLNSADVTGTLPIANGGTGATSFTSGSILRGNGGSSFDPLTGGAVGHVPTWNGATWVSQAPAGGGVSSFNTRTGAVTLTSGDVTGALGYTPPTLSGTNSWSGANTFSNLTSGGGTPVTMGSSTPAGVGINCGAYNFTAGTSIYRANSGDGSIVISNGGSAQFVFGTNATFTSSGGPIVSTGGGSFSGLYPNSVVIGNASTGMASDGSTVIGWQIASSNVMNITSGGDLRIFGSNATKASGTTWINPSDARLKDKITNYTGGLAQLMRVEPKVWEFNGKGDTKAGTKGIGVIADEIEKVLPNTVSTYKAKLNRDDASETNIKQFDATEITWLLVNSVKELKREVNDLRAEIAALRAKQ